MEGIHLQRLNKIGIVRSHQGWVVSWNYVITLKHIIKILINLIHQDQNLKIYRYFSLPCSDN